MAPGLEAGRALEDCLHRGSIRDLVEPILPRASTQAEELSTQVELVEDFLPRASTQAELVEDFHHRVSTQEVEVLLPRVNIPVEEVEVPHKACLPPALGLVVSP